MKIKKFNELFSASKVASALTKDLADHRLTNFIGDIRRKITKVSVVGNYNGKEEKFNSILAAVDYVLDSFRSDSKRKFKTVDISKYAIAEIEGMGKDYGFESAYIGLSKDSESLDFEILISDKRYIGKLKKLLYTPHALVVGKLKFKGK